MDGGDAANDLDALINNLLQNGPDPNYLEEHLGLVKRENSPPPPIQVVPVAAVVAPVLLPPDFSLLMRKLLCEERAAILEVLSKLDFVSLCQLSKTNKIMRGISEDDYPWKVVYGKDFEHDRDVVPSHGWKRYYRATRDVLKINGDFYRSIRTRFHPLMHEVWLEADYVQCILRTGAIFSGHTQVMQRWGAFFQMNQEDLSLLRNRDVRARVIDKMAWVTMTTYFGEERRCSSTNVFELHNRKWRIVLHHTTPINEDARLQDIANTAEQN